MLLQHLQPALPRAERATHDQWQVQVQAQIQRKARVLVRADGVTASQLRDAWLEPVDARDLSGCVEELVRAAGPNARLALLPQGPQTIPYIADAQQPGAPGIVGT